MDNVIDFNEHDDAEPILTETGTRSLLGGQLLETKPLGEYLRYGETPRYAVRNKKQGVTISGPDGETQIAPGGDYAGLLLVSDERLLFAIGTASGDRTRSLPLVDVVTVRQDDGLLNTTLIVTSVDDKRYEFPCRGDVTPVREFVDRATSVWSAAEHNVEEAETSLETARDALEAGDVDDTLAAVEDGFDHLETARERARELDRVVSAIADRADETEADLAVVNRRAHVKRGARKREAATDRWDDHDFGEAYDLLSAALSAYDAALGVDTDTPPDDAIIEVRDEVARDRTELSEAPMNHAERAVEAAREAPYSAAALAWWQRALDRYHDALALDWGADERRFAGSTEEIRDRLATVADRLVTAHCEVAKAQLAAGDALLETDPGVAEHAYEMARETLETARETASELAPGTSGRVEGTIKELDSRWDRLLAARAASEQAPEDAADTATDDESPADEGGAGATQQDGPADSDAAATDSAAAEADDGPAAVAGDQSDEYWEDTPFSSSRGQMAGADDTGTDGADTDGSVGEQAAATARGDSSAVANEADRGVSPYVLRSVDGENLPALVASLFEQAGWSVSDVDDETNDHYDMLARTETPVDVRVLVWTVHPDENDGVDARQVDRYAAILDRNDADVAAVATVAPVSQTARQRAADHGLRLIDVDTLADRVSDLAPPALDRVLPGE